MRHENSFSLYRIDWSLCRISHLRLINHEYSLSGLPPAGRELSASTDWATPYNAGRQLHTESTEWVNERVVRASPAGRQPTWPHRAVNNAGVIQTYNRSLPGPRTRSEWEQPFRKAINQPHRTWSGCTLTAACVVYLSSILGAKWLNWSVVNPDVAVPRGLPERFRGFWPLLTAFPVSTL